MADLRSLLTEFQGLLEHENGEKEVVVSVLKRVLGKEVARDDISFQRGYMRVRSHAYLKSELFLKKDEILREIKKEGITKTIKGIR